MSTNRAFVSHSTSFAREFCDDHIKLCFLWYDEVIIETITKHGESLFFKNLLDQCRLSRKNFHCITDIVLPFEKRAPRELFEENWKVDIRGYPRWRIGDEKHYTYRIPQNAEEHAHNLLLKKIEKELGVEKLYGVDVEQAEGRARVAVNAVKLWEKVNSEISCMLQANDDEKLAMTAAQLFRMCENTPTDPFRLFEISVPSLSVVPWDRVIRLRKRGNFDSVREKFSGILTDSLGDLSKAQSELSEIEKKAAENIIEQYRPNVRKVAIETLVENIPGIPGINPASVIFGLRDVKSEMNKEKKFNWFYLLRDIRNLAKESGT